MTNPIRYIRYSSARGDNYIKVPEEFSDKEAAQFMATNYPKSVTYTEDPKTGKEEKIVTLLTGVDAGIVDVSKVPHGARARKDQDD